MEIEIIKNSILEIRGKKVILDFELAKLYEVETRILKQAVRRNIDRFPEDFMFTLNIDEWNAIRSQIVMFNKGKGKFPKYLPFAFTEQGTGNRNVYLTLVGGGAFGNPSQWIFDSMNQAINKFKRVPLELKIVSYGGSSQGVQDFVSRFK
jgi:hypothetical protein